MLLELNRIEKSYDGKPVLNDVSIKVESGEIVVLLGPSGCGKTTLLRIIAGLERPDAGQLFLSGADLTQIPIHKRHFGMVFQDYALFPHKNVSKNVDFGLRMQGWESQSIEKRRSQVLKLVGLEDYEQRNVYDLSGGEQQRVALARSLAPGPQLLLLDEPLGSLDRALRERLMGQLRGILKKAGTTLGQPEEISSIYVTHDQEEAFAIGDRLFIMNEGRIVQEGKPVDLYNFPKNAFVAHFLGMENLIQGETISQSPPIFRTPFGDFRVGRVGKVNKKGDLLLRPDSGRLLSESSQEKNVIEGQLLDISFRGKYYVITLLLHVDGSSLQLKFEFDAVEPLPPIGSSLSVALQSDKLIVLE